MKPETRNFLDAYGNIVIYVLIIIGTVVISNLIWAWPQTTPQVIIIIMCLLVLLDVFRQVLMDPSKAKQLRKIILILIFLLAILAGIYFYFFR